MTRRHILSALFLLSGMILFNACQKENILETPFQPGTENSNFNASDRSSSGKLYIMDNGVAGNNILVFDRSPNGNLSLSATVPTGGLGTGSGLGSQNSIVLSNNYVVACNAGSNEISLFREDNGTLKLLDKIASNGIRPTSASIREKTIYVLNAGGTGNISGFRFNPSTGKLTHIEGSDKPLSGNATAAAQIQFSPVGNNLIVTERATKSIVSYPLSSAGVAGNPVVQASNGVTPFGFAFSKHNTLLVTEAFGGMPGLSATSSYTLNNNGILQTVSASVPTNQTAACWIAVSNNGKFCYTTNAGSGTVSGYSIANDGSLQLLNASGAAATVGAAPIDMSFSRDSKFLYTLNNGAHTLSILGVSADGSLSNVATVGNIPVGAAGMAAW